jgi:hypothetical protein
MPILRGLEMWTRLMNVPNLTGLGLAEKWESTVNASLSCFAYINNWLPVAPIGSVHFPKVQWNRSLGKHSTPTCTCNAGPATFKLLLAVWYADTLWFSLVYSDHRWICRTFWFCIAESDQHYTYLILLWACQESPLHLWFNNFQTENIQVDDDPTIYSLRDIDMQAVKTINHNLSFTGSFLSIKYCLTSGSTTQSSFISSSLVACFLYPASSFNFALVESQN